jgi:hypothetical protein
MGDASTSESATTIHWTEMLEEYFATTGEKAHCLAWVHKRSESIYSKRRTYIDLPVIVGSGVIAFLNAGSQSLFADPKISSIALGIGSLFVGIVNTMGTYFGWAKRAEGHRISAIHYSRLYRFISVELSLPRDERMNPNDFLKYVKDQYDRLQEISPMVPEIVIHEFQEKFAKIQDIAKPEEANGLEKISVFRNDMEAVMSSPSPSSPFTHIVDRNDSTMISNPMNRLKTGVNAVIKQQKLAAATMAAAASIASAQPKDVGAITPTAKKDEKKKEEKKKDDKITIEIPTATKSE